mmetsp:Transcript_6659/g.10400  ORF Transcript_6659/g.10400 Transcript_6659/m.10400 type:complete len:187 (+) Transcript_6659:110-670(+)|eukprot:CAMPEP_0178797220 /NCGR_PEP_ID=MMETSP0745-20121128/11098_1 /TAXON_ID=913974 /ORGANISM="Nitzschia punctata, Strain CCMP561" /LENGTH=186 /DNA_ID=CAMNT_0020455775 /DNA_START=44 /DNA_END=604 /DNA_ORIENTATION=-
MKRSLAFVFPAELRHSQDMVLLTSGCGPQRKRFRKMVPNEHDALDQPQHFRVSRNDSSPTNTRRVSFCPLVERIYVPSIAHSEEEKKAAFYSKADLYKFAMHEKLRRQLSVLTIQISNEQKKRARFGQPFIPSTKILLLYHSLLTTSRSSYYLSHGQGHPGENDTNIMLLSNARKLYQRGLSSRAA